MSLAEYPLKAICDTSVYIPFINQGIVHPVFSDKSVRPVLHMSAVVLSELYAGAHDNQSIKLLDKLYQTFLNVGRLIVPDGVDWRKTGGILAKLQRKYGFEEKYIARLQNDILIACSARKIGAFVVSQNIKDFLRIKEFIDFMIYE
jgi:predicted nucleic acid-binding protein